jgi:hypothetical protein
LQEFARNTENEKKKENNLPGTFPKSKPNPKRPFFTNK